MRGKLRDVFFWTVCCVLLGSGIPGWCRDTVTIAIYQEPETLNVYLGTQAIIGVVIRPVAEGLIGINPQGEFYPVLVEEVPTVQNGGVSADGLQVTYKLKRGITWQDGAPLTAADIKFTWEAIINPKNLVKTQSGYNLITAIDTPDPWTVVLTFRKLYTSYLTLFPCILPKHILEKYPDMNEVPYNRQLVGTGPFLVKEWVSGDHITLQKNPNYREAEKVHLERIFFRIVPSQAVALSLLQTGAVDIVWGLTEGMMPHAKRIEEAYLQITPGHSVERLVLNLSSPTPPHNGDPNFPHPILGDQRVRQAMQYAIDKQKIVDTLLYGKTEVATSVIPMGWAHDPSLLPSPYNPQKAIRLLEEAGWREKVDEGGIRYKDGKRLSLEIMTTTGNKLREQIEQVLQAMFRRVGIELRIRNVPASVLFGSWAKNSDRKHGRFDILLYSLGPSIDPQAHLYEYFHSSRIPSAANQGQGANYSRLRDEIVDRAIEAGGATIDLEKRKEVYSVLQHRLNDLLPHILLYNPLSINAVSRRLGGLAVNPWESLTWNTEDWYIKKP